MSEAIEVLPPEAPVPELPAFEAQTNSQIADFIRSAIEQVETEAREALKMSENAFANAWRVGKACDAVAQRIGDEQWLAFAEQEFGFMLWTATKCMELARLNPKRPPERGGSSVYRFKQVMIAVCEEMPPKPTPRIVDRPELRNYHACFGGLIRFWKEGDKWMERPEDVRLSIAADFVRLGEIGRRMEEMNNGQT